MSFWSFLPVLLVLAGLGAFSFWAQRRFSGAPRRGLAGVRLVGRQPLALGAELVVVALPDGRHLLLGLGRGGLNTLATFAAGEKFDLEPSPVDPSAVPTAEADRPSARPRPSDPARP